MELLESKPVWVAWTNTDLTEGRGQEIPSAVCDNIVTAERLGKGRSVQGSNCRVTEEVAVKIGSRWLAPCKIEYATEKDKVENARRIAKEDALNKARQAGLTDEEIELLK